MEKARDKNKRKRVELNKDYCFTIDGYYFKDSEGVVWQIIKTPYKKLPISNL